MSRVDRYALYQVAAGQDWAHLLPRDADGEEERAKKKRQLLKLHNVRQDSIAAGKRSAAAAQRGTASGRQPLPPPAGGTGWRQTVRNNEASKRRRWEQRKETAQEEPSPPAAAAAAAAAPAGSAAAAAAAAAGSTAAAAAPGTGPPPPQAAEPAEGQPLAGAGAGGHADDCGALAEEDGGAAAGAECHTPVTARMLPGPGQAGRQHAGGSGGGASAAGTGQRSASATGGSSGGIPTAPSSSRPGSDAGTAGTAGTAVARRRRLQGTAGAEPAVGSGRLPLSAGGLLSGLRAPVVGQAGRAAAAPTSFSRPQLPQPASAAAERPAAQPRGRRWKPHSNPLTRLLQHNAPPPQQQQPPPPQQQQQEEDDGGRAAFQPNRPTRFAAYPSPAAVPPSFCAPSSLTTQLGSLQQPRDWGPIRGTQEHAEWQAEQAAAAQRAEQAARQRGSSRAGPPVELASLLMMGCPPAAQPLEERAAEQQQQQQQQQQPPPPQPQPQPPQPPPPPQQQQPPQPPLQLGQHGQLGQQAPGSVARSVRRASGTAATGTGGLLGTGWSLPPTPNCLYNLSPDPSLHQPAAAAAAAAAAAGSGGRRREPWSFGVAAAATAATPCSSAAAGRPRSSAGRPLGSAAPGAVPRRLPEFSCVAETPLLFGSPGSRPQQGERHAGSAEDARQLFVAETPSDPAAEMDLPADGPAPAQPQQTGCGPAAAPAQQQQPASVRAEAATPAGTAASAGLQLLLPQPVLQAVPCADGRHLALLLGSFAPVGEPTDVLVLRLPAGPRSAAAADASSAAAQAGTSAAFSGVQVVASVAVQRSRWAEGLELTPNCLQLASTDRAGLLLILSAALEPADQSPPSQPSILVLPLPAAASRAAGPGMPGPRQVAAAAPAQGAPVTGRRPLPPLAVESAHPLTCVLLAGGRSLLASGDGGGEVRRLDFDPLWRSYTWACRFPPAAYRAVQFEDVLQLQLYRCREQGRQLLLGLSSGGSVALWDVASCELLVARASGTYRLRSLHPISMQQAGLATPLKQRVERGGAAPAPAAAAGPSTSTSTQLFVGMMQHRQSGEEQVGAVMLSRSGLSVSACRLEAQPPPQAGGRPQQRQRPERRPAATGVALAGGRCWVGTSGGDLLAWDAHSGAVQGCCRCGSGPVASLCAVPAPDGGSEEAGAGGWQLASATAGGACTVLARC